MVPFKKIHVVKPDGSVVQGSSIEISGQTVVQANSIEDAIAMTKNCHFLKINGSLEVAEVVEMS